MVKVKKLRSNVTTKARMWDALPWKAVDVDKENLGDFEESVFFGLEEIDGNAYKLSKTGDNGMRPEAVDVSDVTTERAVKKTKKGKKSTSEVAVGAGDDETANEEPIELPEPTKKNNKKRKQTTLVNLSEIENAVVDADVASATDKKKKQKKSKAQIVEIAEEADDVEEEGARIGSLKALYINAPAALVKEDVSYLKNDSEWAPGLKLSELLTQALVALGFETPTPIQTNAIPLTTVGGTDIVGAAETGSGKTLAFSLPIIHSLLHNWETCSNLRIPHALIVAPTRELAMQIATVIREVSSKVSQICEQYKTDAERAEAEADATAKPESETVAVSVGEKLSKKAQKALKKKPLQDAKKTVAPKRARVSIETVSIVGGMSEQKQRRQLAGKGKPVHIVVATPGRLCEMFEDPENVSFQDMSKLRFLVVDEADRIMEEGHYAEV